MRFLVVGSPVAHSLSPVMMTAAFRAAGLDATYEAREIPPEAWPEAMAGLHADGIAGMNVTVPHKEEALAGAREATVTARSIGAANTLIRIPGGWRADNTDGPGFLRWLVDLGRARLAREEALVLGAGGSARAVVWALLDAGCPRIRLANRTLAHAAAIAGRSGRVEAEELGGRAPEGGLVVNCTSLGMDRTDPLPISAASVRGAGLVLDLVYPETPLVRTARAAGVDAEAGLGLLVAQGALSFEGWTGKVADREAMRAAVEAAGSRPGE